jgi:tRNA 2-thiouridine synthesizing protein A
MEAKTMSEGKSLKGSIKLDLSGLNCPLPILKTKKMLGNLESGQLIYVTSTDSGSYNDFKYFCEHTGHQLISREERDLKYYFLIKKK